MRETQQQDNGPGQPVHKKSWIDVKLDTWGPRARNLTHIIGLFAALGLPALLYAYGGPWFEAARQRVFPPPPGGQAQPIPPTSPAPAPKGKGVTTGALPDPYLRPQPANDCIQEGSHVELLDALWQQSERSDQSALRIEGGKLCRPWHAVVHGYERRGAGVRYTLRASTSQWGPFIFADVSSSANVLPVDTAVKVEGVVQGYEPTRFVLLWGHVWLKDARVQRR
jgi:hypothetical protein